MWARSILFCSTVEGKKKGFFFCFSLAQEKFKVEGLTSVCMISHAAVCVCVCVHVVVHFSVANSIKVASKGKYSAS